MPLQKVLMKHAQGVTKLWKMGYICGVRDDFLNTKITIADTIVVKLKAK